MTTNYWTLETHGDPLGSIQQFLNTVWHASRLAGMLVTMNGGEESSMQPRYIEDSARLAEINPFKPLMLSNAARAIPELLREHPQQKMGLLLRPCEMRALQAMTERVSLDLENLLTISVDCLGTLPAEEYHWRAERKEAVGNLAQEALQFARQGGIVAYRNRPACQICAEPQAKDADLNIHVFGLPVRHQILISTRQDAMAEVLNHITNGLAADGLIEQHQRVLAKMAERHHSKMERVVEGLGNLLPVDLETVVQQLESCGACQSCLNVCPICLVERPRRDQDGHYNRKDIARWLASCAGCGMCEQACPNHLPLSAIFAHIRTLLSQGIGEPV